MKGISLDCQNKSWSDQEYLLTEQYQNTSNLIARIQLHERFSTNQYGWHRWVFDQIHLLPDSHILELGCGPGTLWLKNMDRIPHSWDIMLSDFSPGMLQEARTNLCGSAQHFEFEVIDAQWIPFEDERFDAVIANHMLYHVPDKVTALSEIRRVLRPGGRFYASTIGQSHLQELNGLVRRFVPTWNERPPQSFLLENGLDQIASWFSKVVLHRYTDALVVTEVEPLVAYVLSTDAKSVLVGGRLTEFASFLEQELVVHGAIYISKDSGVFEAW